MLNLEGVISVKQVRDVREYVSLRLREPEKYVCADAVGLYEQKYIDDLTLHRLCEEAYNRELFEPSVTFVPREVVRLFEFTGGVPVSLISATKEVTVAYLLEHGVPEVADSMYRYNFVPVPIHYYLREYQRCYGRHQMLQDVPAKILFETIVQEAIAMKAADITISTRGKAASVYYDVGLKKVHSNRLFNAEDIQDIIKYITMSSPFDFTSKMPKKVDIDLTPDYRGRVVINPKFKGFVITIRVAPNEAFHADVSTLNMSQDTVDFLKQHFLEPVNGLRLFVGATRSGKNTSILSMLMKLIQEEDLKVVSVEMPVEQELPGIEQINCDTVDEYVAAVNSLIRQNPGFVYITEMNEETGATVIRTTNTGKRVASTLHTNSVADTITRLQDITGISSDELIQVLHSIVYQKLIIDPETNMVRPVNRYVLFTKELKRSLYGKSTGEVIALIQEAERGDVIEYY